MGGVTGEYNLYQYQQPAFGALTTQGSPKAIRSEGYHQASAQGVPNTTPQVVAFGIPTTEDMERASQIIASGIDVSSLREAGAVTNPYAAKGAGWEQFQVPKNNGTGELIANISGREDEIPECEWEPYFA